VATVPIFTTQSWGLAVERNSDLSAGGEDVYRAISTLTGCQQKAGWHGQRLSVIPSSGRTKA